MIGPIFTFFLLYVMIKASEGRRQDVDGLLVVTVALIPALAVIVVTGVLRPIGLEPVIVIGIRALVLAVVTCGLLWKFLGIPAGRSLAFTAIAILVSETPGFMIYVWPDVAG